MVFVKLIGRLGNQMYIYSIAKAIQKKTGLKVAIYYSKKSNPEIFNLNVNRDIFLIKKYLKSKNILLYFKSKTKLIYFIRKIIQILKYKISKKRFFMNKFNLNPALGDYDENVFNIKDNTLLKDDYFQSFKYLNDEIKQELIDEFTPKYIPIKTKNKSLEIENNENAIFIHLRRGDYNHICFFSKLGLTYYKTAIDYQLKINKNAYFYIFSDDIKFVSEKFIKILNLSNFEIINLHSEKEAYLDMYLMTKAKGGIIANSTFSLWASYLLKDRIFPIVAPYPFHYVSNNIDILPSDYVIIDYIWGEKIDIL